MSHSIKTIEKWKEDYPLLKDIWIKYDGFDKDIENDPKKQNYISVCSFFIKEWNGEEEKNMEFCKKLVRNLGHHSGNNDFLRYTSDRCRNLNNWAYNSMKKHSIPEDLLTRCFEEYKGIVEDMKQTPTCFYYEYDKKYKEPLKIIMLNIFASNIDIIKKILEGKIDPVHCSCQKFIKDVVSIYKYIKKTYCSNNILMGNSNTCQELASFAGSYYFLYNDSSVRDKIPSLESEKHVNLLGCESDKSLRGTESSETYPKQTPAETPPPPPQIHENNDSNNPMSPTVSTALGTVAGASSLLALLYKFSPGRNWIRSGFSGVTGRIRSNLYADQPNEVFYDGFEGEVMSSYNPTYNVGYGSA
ncbi:VIR protein [Plasmodium vivax]|uniref:VIR protein n=1 Tax=Plasmodium vivax TaxID=5855 RepID=A0A1G4GSC1_PLAVI|nr:VIR protein [Plasmodium vivax]